MTPNLSEYEKTLLSIYQAEGINAVRRYFRKHERLSEDQIEDKVFNGHANLWPEYIEAIKEEVSPQFSDTLNPPTFNIPDTLVAPLQQGEEKKIPTQEQLPQETIHQSSETITKTVTVTFVDGSTQEVEVGPDGVVVNPVIPVLNMENAIKSHEEESK